MGKGTRGISVFEHNRQVTVVPRGIWLDRCGFIGGSRDELCVDDAIVKVKCPYKWRESKSLISDMRDKSYIIYINEHNEVVLNTNHDYYHQMQGNLYLTRRRVCHLVISTPSESAIYDVPIEEGSEENIHLLKDFYLNKYIPFLSGNKTL
ncbi:uncharacterized protein LOC126892610 [Diabrotica virgifera virgifera]|uniref:YqaJ viral recombinase domain-containing protein n=1 Tax=Diabrotica virgifera virgifera TaxID=50390 RepID=A0ABM5L6S7_DIAVI|nr:uncharacterized protein LOC126892610 [Diabrotica virgifera virgifera]